MVVYDKAKWQIEGGIPVQNVVNHFSFIFEWLEKNDLLNEYGKQTHKIGLDEFLILCDEMVTEEGKHFLDKCYDEYIGKVEYGENENSEELDKMFNAFK